MKVAYACVLTAVCAHEACPSSDPTCSAAEEAALLQHAAKRHVKVEPSPCTIESPSDKPKKSSKCVDDPECKQDFVDKLASSWKASSDEPFLVGIGQKIFTLTPEVVTRNEWHQMTSSDMEGDTNEESTQRMSVDMGIDASYYAFEGKAQLSVKAMTSSKTASFYSKQFDQFVDFEMVSDVLDPADVITPEAKKILTTWTVQQIHDTLGDFYATKLSFGGTVAKTIVTTMYEDESAASLSSSMQAEYGKAFLSGKVKASFSGKTSFSGSGHNFTTKTTVNGGDELLWISDLNHNCSNYEEVKCKWGKAMTEDTMIPVKFALQPLWRVIEHTDSAKSEELKKYMLKVWKNSRQILPYGMNPKKWTLLGLGVCDANCGGDSKCGVFNVWRRYGNRQSLEECQKMCEDYVDKDDGSCDYITFYHVDEEGWPRSVCKGYKSQAKCEKQSLGNHPDSVERPINGSMTTWMLHRT